MLVLPALIRMQDKSSTFGDRFKGFLQHRDNHSEHRPIRDRIADQILAAQIQNGRKVQFLTEQGERSYIGNPFWFGFSA